jgi:glycosyltransferase involved in cell wall biosynthesis
VLKGAASSAATLLSISRAVTASISHPRIITIPEPIEAPPSPVRASRRNGRPAVGYLGRLDPRKGVEDVCRAAATVDAEFLIAGAPLLADESYVDELKKLAQDSAPGKVRFLGPVSDPWEFLSRLDVLVVPSRREPWGRVAAEALIAGVPVIAADTGGLPEIVRDGVDGCLYHPGDVTVLVEKLEWLLSNDELRMRIGQSTSDSVERFMPENHAKHVAQALDDVLLPAHGSGA